MFRVPLVVLPFATLVVLPSSAGAQAPLAVPYETASQTRGATPKFAHYIDSIAGAIGVPPLRKVALPPGYRELRMWDGFGVAYPFSLLRMVVRDSEVQAEMFRWQPAGSSAETVESSREYLRRHWSCPDAVVAGGFLWCEVEFTPDTDWKEVLEQLEAHRVWSLPGESEAVGVDGATLVVEMRETDLYRTYDYWIVTCGDSEEKDARALHFMVFGILDEAPESENEKCAS